MDDTIRAIYRGISPQEEIESTKGEYMKARNRAYTLCEEMERKIPDELKSELEEVYDALGDAWAAAAEEGFNSGFTLAVKLMVEVFSQQIKKEPPV